MTDSRRGGSNLNPKQNEDGIMGRGSCLHPAKASPIVMEPSPNGCRKTDCFGSQLCHSHEEPAGTKVIKGDEINRWHTRTQSRRWHLIAEHEDSKSLGMMQLAGSMFFAKKKIRKEGKNSFKVPEETVWSAHNNGVTGSWPGNMANTHKYKKVITAIPDKGRDAFVGWIMDNVIIGKTHHGELRVKTRWLRSRGVEHNGWEARWRWRIEWVLSVSGLYFILNVCMLPWGDFGSSVV